MAASLAEEEAILDAVSDEDRARRAERRPFKILLAEDNPVNRKVALLMLKRIGYRADTVLDGLEAVETLERRPYDIVLMDVQMPELDGVEATRRIRSELDPDRQPFIIAMTAHAINGDRERYLDAGMDAYVSKPIRIEELEAALDQVPLDRPPSEPIAVESSPTP